MSDFELEEEIVRLRLLLQSKEEELVKLRQQKHDSSNDINSTEDPIPKWAVERYSRQLLVTELAPPAQNIKSLLKASILVVGAGGLGCPAASYLVGAGVGHVGIIDYDDVELTNIHRQLLHSELSVGMSKVDSAALALRRLNSKVKVSPYKTLLDSSNALDIINQYDVVLDATDNIVTRYLLNDACVLAGKPLITASALKMEGQLTIYNHVSQHSKSSGVCMRCIFPIPPPPAAVGSCSQQGVLGPVPGVMGTLQALEAIKLLVGAQTLSGSMLIFDGMECSFRTVKLRGKNPKCEICSPSLTIRHLIDYTQFCNSQPSDKDMKLDILSPDQRLTPKEFCNGPYNDMQHKGVPSVSYSKLLDGLSSCGDKILVDVRSVGEFDMCNIAGSINIPIERIEGKSEELVNVLHRSGVKEVYFLCRRGNDSQVAAKELTDKFTKLYPADRMPLIKDIVGGLHQWSREVDSNFPVY